MYQNKCLVRLRGIRPGIILSNPMNTMTRPKSMTKDIPGPEIEAEWRSYWLPDRSGLALPSRNILAGFIQACSGYKLPSNKKLSLAPIVAGDVMIEEEYIPFLNSKNEKIKDYSVLVTRVVVQKNGVLRGRPLIQDWEMEFILEWESQFLGKDFHLVILPELLKTLGERIGLGEWRPARKGPYGRFRVLKIEKID